MRTDSDESAPETLRLLLQHCRDMKRQETCSRFATCLLLLTLFTTFFVVCGHSCKDGAKEQAVTPLAGVAQARKKGMSGRAHELLQCHHQNPTTMQNNSLVIRWNTQTGDSSSSNLKNNTNVVVPSKGWYLLNLRLSFRVPDGPCPCKEDSLCHLSVFIQQKMGYPTWRDVIEGKETMSCKVGSQQAITLIRVARLENATELRVIIDAENRDLLSRASKNYFDILRL